MLELDRIPDWAGEQLKTVGADVGDLQLAVRCDRARDQSPGEVFLLADAGTLYIADRAGQTPERYPLSGLSGLRGGRPCRAELPAGRMFFAGS